MTPETKGPGKRTYGPPWFRANPPIGSRWPRWRRPARGVIPGIGPRGRPPAPARRVVLKIRRRRLRRGVDGCGRVRRPAASARVRV